MRKESDNQMGTLKENIRESNSAIKEWFEDFKRACVELANTFLGEDIEDVEAYGDMEQNQAIELATAETIKENPEMSKDLNKVEEALAYEGRKREKWAGELFKFEIPETIVSEKDEDGYHKIEDKVTKHIKAEVSEQQAREASEKGREKGGKQKTRVDED